MSYGYCPVCYATAVSRERSPTGKTRCSSGHSFPHAQTLLFPPSSIQQSTMKIVAVDPESFKTIVPNPVTVDPDSFKTILTAVPVTPTQSAPSQVIPARQGALVYAVSTQSAADALTPLLTQFPDPQSDGVRVIPFGTSAVAYTGRSNLPFRGLVVIRPRDAGIDVKEFERWVHAAIRPYLAPGAPTVTL